MNLNTKQEFFFPNSPSEKYGVTLQSDTKLNMLCRGIFMKTEGCEGWLRYIPITSPFPVMNIKLHSQTLSIYIFPLIEISMLTQ